MRKKSLAKTIHTLTIGEYSLYHRTANIKHLKRFWWCPNWLVDVSDLVNEIDAELGGGTNEKLQKEKHKLNSQYKIQKLIVLYQALVNTLVHETQVNIWRKEIGKPIKESKNSKTYIDDLYDTCQIKIKSIDDLKRIISEIERRVDKFKEYFTDKPVENGLTFDELMMGYLSASNQQIGTSYNMKMSHFISLKKDIDKQVLKNG